MSAVLGELIDYTATHFKGEEEQMVKYNYPDLERHKEIHDLFVSKVLEAKREFESGQAMLGPELMKFLGDWLVNHIQKMYAQ
mgnify:FL=1